MSDLRWMSNTMSDPRCMEWITHFVLQRTSAIDSATQAKHVLNQCECIHTLRYKLGSVQICYDYYDKQGKSYVKSEYRMLSAYFTSSVEKC